MIVNPILNDPEGILIVGEHPGKADETSGLPFSGHSGHMITANLMSAGIVPSYFAKEYGQDTGKSLGHYVRDHHPAVAHISLAQVSRSRPHDSRIENFFANKTDGKKRGLATVQGWHCTDSFANGLGDLKKTIQAVRPRLILALGSTALWALTGAEGSGNSKSPAGIARWRGSQLTTEDGIPVLPSLDPAAILRQYAQRVVLQHDIVNRAGRFWRDECTKWWTVERTLNVAPSFNEAHLWLNLIQEAASAGDTIVTDIETSHHSFVTNVGFALSSTVSYTIPLRCVDGHYWTSEQETHIKERIRRILTTPQAVVVMQNGEYDRCYFLHEFLCVANLTRDTRTIHHTHYPSLPADLAFLSSLYNEEHIYWKDESGEAATNRDDLQGWRYNGKDCCSTWEVDQKLQEQTERLGMQEQVDFEMGLHALIQPTMHRGVRVSKRRLEAISNWNITEQLKLSGELEAMVGTFVGTTSSKSPWYRSPTQTKTLLYEWFDLPVVTHRKTRRPTVDDDALPILYKREPLVRPIIERLASLRKLATQQSNLLKRRLRGDRWVTQYTVPGTDTLRFASSMDGMDYGLNLQNISGGQEAADHEVLDMPNAKTLIIPDIGHVLNDIDLDRADLQVVVWDSGDEKLKRVLRQGLDLHQSNADDIGCTRAAAKAGVHATNYYCQPPTLARVLDVSITEAKNFQRRWFEAHPEIKRWQDGVRNALMTGSKVTNAFGFHCHYWGRVEQDLPNALAWIPQSTIAHVINRAWLQLMENPITSLHTKVTMQVHDSLVIEWKRGKDVWLRPLVAEQMNVTIPYEDPLVISTGIKTSLDSWGDCQEVPWHDKRPDPQRFRSPE